MNVGMGRRGHDAQAVHDDTLRTMQDAIEKAQLADQAANDIGLRCTRLEEQKEQLEEDKRQLRVAVRDAYQDAAALREQRDALLAWCLPMLEPGTFTDDPMPADARVSRKPSVHDLKGSWEPVPGDRADDWGHVPAVDFDAIRSELGLHDQETAEVTA